MILREETNPQQARQRIDLVRYLIGQGVPCTPPKPGDNPLEQGRRWVSAWEEVAHDWSGGPVGGKAAGLALKQLHLACESFAGPLPKWHLPDLIHSDIARIEDEKQKQQLEERAKRLLEAIGNSLQDMAMPGAAIFFLPAMARYGPTGKQLQCSQGNGTWHLALCLFAAWDGREKNGTPC